jgi:hypothetical protein
MTAKVEGLRSLPKLRALEWKHVWAANRCVTACEPASITAKTLDVLPCQTPPFPYDNPGAVTIPDALMNCSADDGLHRISESPCHHSAQTAEQRIREKKMFNESFARSSI